MTFDVPRLFGAPRYRALSEAAVSSAASGSCEPLASAVTGEDEAELAAFATSTQGVAALLARASSREALPVPLARFLEEDAARTAARAARLRATLGEALAALRQGGLEVVLLKGAALVQAGLADPGERPMGDLDLLLADPGGLGEATRLLERATPFRALLDTPRHRVFVLPGERVALPAAEHPENPLRIELHRTFRLPVLGEVYDATADLRLSARTLERDGLQALVPGEAALVRHLLHHAAEDFGARGLRGVQAHDFRLLSRRLGPLSPALPAGDLRAAGPLLFAADAVQRLFPGSFAPAFVDALARGVDPSHRARAAALAPLRSTRPARGFTREALALAARGLPRGRFLLRQLFPSPGEVQVNVTDGAGGLRLAAAYAALLARRAAGALRAPRRPAP